MRMFLMAVSVALAVHSRGAQPQQVARVMSGELKEARASWWGFDKADATRALQEAIDSRVPRLIVDDMGAPWITDKLMCVGGQEIVFEAGVEVLAKQGSFTGKNDSLFTLDGVTNVTLRGYGAVLRMRRADYDAPPYAKAEWRHVLNIRSSVGIKVYGLTLAESGGDGIYLGCAKGLGPNRDIHIKDVVCDKNYRQGISVISAEDLLIEDTVMRDTAGTPPAAGIDFEPNRCDERLKNCVMRNCLTENNQGDGYEFYLPNLTKASEPVSVLIENCRSVGDRTAVRVVTANAEGEAVAGEVVFRDCGFERSRNAGIIVSRKPADGMALAFERCTVSGCGEGGTQEALPDILLTNRGEDDRSVGGIRFSDVTVLQRQAHPWIVWQNKSAEDAPVAGLTGTVLAGEAGKLQRVDLTPEWVAERFPVRFPVRVPRVAGDLSKVRVTDLAEGMQRLSPLRVRRKGRYVFYAAKGQAVVLRGEQSRVGRYEAAVTPLMVSDPSGKAVTKVPLPPFREKAEIVFTAAEAGFYTLDVDVGANAFALLEANVPVAFDAIKRAVGLIASSGSLYVPVPQGTAVFAFGVAGEGDGEAVKATVADPSGKTVWERGGIIQIERCMVTDEAAKAGGLWQVTLGRPSHGGFEDFHVEALGVPGYLFLSKDRYWE